MAVEDPEEVETKHNEEEKLQADTEKRHQEWTDGQERDLKETRER